jgi:UDP-glucose 4-epimerase
LKRALITGGVGFIGFHLARLLLENGYEVVIADNLSRGVVDPDFRTLLEQPRLTFVQLNLLHANALDAIQGSYDLIFHLAAIIGVANVLTRPYEVLTSNVTMQQEALRFAQTQSGLRRFVFASTSEVYAGTLQYFELPLPTPESVPLAVTDLSHPRTSYMLSKIYGEAMCHQSGVPYTVVRPHNVYGPRMGMAHVVPELLKKGYEAPVGSEIVVASVAHRRAFCYIDDAIELILRSAESDRCRNDVINIGNQDGETSIQDVASTIFSVLGKDLKIIPGAISPGSPSNRWPDMSKAVNATRFKPRVTLREGIQKTYDWYLANVFEGANASAV